MKTATKKRVMQAFATALLLASGCGPEASDSVEEDIGSAAQPLTVGTATVRVQNYSNCDIDTVTVDHKYSDVYRNAKVFSNIPRGWPSFDTLQVRYNYGALTTGRDWWRVTWTCKGSTTLYFSDPSNAQGFLNGLEDIYLGIRDWINGLIEVGGGDPFPMDTFISGGFAPQQATFDAYNQAFAQGLRLAPTEREQDAHLTAQITESLNSLASKRPTTAMAMMKSLVSVTAMLAADLSLSHETTSGFKQHMLTSEDADREMVIRIWPHGVVIFESRSGTSTTGVSTSDAYTVREYPGAETACFSVHADLQGDYYCLRPNQTLTYVGDELNDEFSSVLVSGGVAIACLDSNLSGGCTTLSGRQDNFGSINDTISSIKYVYRDSAAWTPYAPWGAGEPNNVGDEDCVTLVGSSGKLSDISCTGSARYLCSTEGSVKTFKVTTAQGPWSHGDAACANEFPGYIFAPGVTHSEVQDAKIAMQNAAASVAWTSLNDIAMEGTFVTDPGLLEIDTYSDSRGWSDSPAYAQTIQYPMLTPGGGASVCGRHANGILCTPWQSGRFTPATIWTADFSDGSGFAGNAAYWQTLQFPDVNGDGKADVCGRGAAGIYCGTNAGSSFNSTTLWTSAFSDASGFAGNAAYWQTIQFPDVNGDGKADVCGRGAAGIYCGISTGAGFGPATLWSYGSEFSDAYGWNAYNFYWQTIKFPDLNRDGKADVCGRGFAGISCQISTGAGFSPTTLWTSDFRGGPGQDWAAADSYWQTIDFPDVNGDGYPDVCGRGAAGIHCATSRLPGNIGFTQHTVWSNVFADSSGWTRPEYWQTIRFMDVDGDGRSDVCARASAGYFCATAKTDGSGFNAPTWLAGAAFSDAKGWNLSSNYWQTIRPVMGGIPQGGTAPVRRVCGRGPGGVTCVKI